jgi:hypothetical protein
MASILNYQIGKGIVSIDGTDVGNSPMFDFEPSIKTEAHYSSRLGTKFKDLEVATEYNGKLIIELDEITQANLLFAVLGVGADIMVAPWANHTVSIDNTNNVGPKFIWTFPLVRIFPAKKISLIGDKFTNFQLEGTVFGDTVTGSFGTFVPV